MYYIWKEWKENIKGKGLWISFGIIVLVSISLLFKSSALSFEQGFNVLLINLFDAFIYFIPIICLFLGAFALFQEKEQKTLIMLLTGRDSFNSFLFKKSAAVQAVLDRSNHPLVFPVPAAFKVFLSNRWNGLYRLFTFPYLFNLDFYTAGDLNWQYQPFKNANRRFYRRCLVLLFLFT